jgi:hypothetical protein
MPNRLQTLMPGFIRHEGRWIGTYTIIDPSGAQLDRYEVRILAEFPTEGCDFRLNTHNIWPDGRETTGRYEAHFRDGRLWFEDQLVGALWEIDDFSVYLRFSFEHDPSITVCEMIQISDDGQHRARTWHWFRDQKLFQITLAEERRDTA